jgi:hypothetical protein
MPNYFQQAMGLIPKLTADERRELKVVIGQFRGEHSAASRGKPEKRVDGAAGDWLLAGIVWELARRGLGRSRIDATLVRRLAPAYEEAATEIRERLTKQLDKPRQEELVSLGRVVARAIADHRSPQTPLGLKFMLNNTRNALEAIDSSFPGYLAAGMLPYLLRPPKAKD